MADHAHDHDHAHSDAHYIKIWGILLVLLVISIVGPMFEILWLTLITAFGIAFVKAGLVVKHFMHLTVENPIIHYILITCLVFMVLLFAGTAPDVMNHEGQNWDNHAAKAEVNRVMATAGDGHGDHGDAAADPAAKDSHDAAPAAEKQKPWAELSSDDEKKAWLMALGEKVYNKGGAKAPAAACVACHQGTGKGMPGAFPPLVGQKDHMGDCAKHAGIILKGMSGEIEVDGTKYNGVMPPLADLTDEETAAVMTYVRLSWGNDFGVCTPEQVAAAR